jgi:hypothetical protein
MEITTISLLRADITPSHREFDGSLPQGYLPPDAALTPIFSNSLQQRGFPSRQPV